MLKGVFMKIQKYSWISVNIALLHIYILCGLSKKRASTKSSIALIKYFFALLQQQIEQEWPFKCEVCDKGFTKKIGLTMHKKKMHAGARPHKCLLCSWSFPTEDGPLGLDQHIHINHKYYA